MKPIIDDIIEEYPQLVNCFQFIRPILGKGIKYQLTVKEWKPRRNLSQNALCWVWNQEIAEYIVEHGLAGTVSDVSADDIHDYLVQKFWGQRVIMIDNVVTKRRQETKKFSVNKMCEHLEKMEFWTGEKEIPLTQTRDYNLALGL